MLVEARVTDPVTLTGIFVAACDVAAGAAAAGAAAAAEELVAAAEELDELLLLVAAAAAAEEEEEVTNAGRLDEVGLVVTATAFVVGAMAAAALLELAGAAFPPPRTIVGKIAAAEVVGFWRTIVGRTLPAATGVVAAAAAREAGLTV